MCTFKNLIGISYRIWYSVEHVVFPMKIGFAPGELDFQQNQFDKNNLLSIIILDKKNAKNQSNFNV